MADTETQMLGFRQSMLYRSCRAEHQRQRVKRDRHFADPSINDSDGNGGKDINDNDGGCDERRSMVASSLL